MGKEVDFAAETPGSEIFSLKKTLGYGHAKAIDIWSHHWYKRSQFRTWVAEGELDEVLPASL